MYVWYAVNYIKYGTILKTVGRHPVFTCIFKQFKLRGPIGPTLAKKISGNEIYIKFI